MNNETFCTICETHYTSRRGLSIHISKCHPDWEIQLQALQCDINNNRGADGLNNRGVVQEPNDQDSHVSSNDTTSLSFPNVEGASFHDDGLSEDVSMSDEEDVITAGSSNQSYAEYDHDYDHVEPQLDADEPAGPPPNHGIAENTPDDPVVNVDNEVCACSFQTEDPIEDHDKFLGVMIHSPMEQQLRLTSISDEDYTMARMYKVCDDAGAPKYLCDKILATLREAMRTGFHPGSGITQRKAYFPRIYKKLKVQSPEGIPIQLHTGEIATVYRFNFESQLQNHLLSQPYSDLQNLDLPNLANPFASMWPHGESPGHTSLVDSTWYFTSTSSRMSLLTTNKYMFHPLSLYIDKTGADGIMKSSLEPLMCTSGILNHTTRQQASNWFMIGCIPNLELASGAGKKKDSLLAIQDYHRCLDILLEPLKNVQKKMPKMNFRRGEFVAEYKIICPVATILGDNLSSDRLCGRITNNTPSSVRMSRCCLTPHQSCDAVPHDCHPVPVHLCERLSMAALGARYGDPNYQTGVRQKRKDPVTDSRVGVVVAIDDDIADDDDYDYGDIPANGKIAAATIPLSPNLAPSRQWMDEQFTQRGDRVHSDLLTLTKKRAHVATVLLQKCLGSHPLCNAFRDVDFGKNNSVHTATVSDIMHSLEEGIITYVMKLLLDPMTETQKASIDLAVEQMFSTNGRNRSGEREQYPRVSFQRGFCSLTQISADEHVGQLFVVSILLRTAHGRKLFDERFAPDFDSKRKVRVDQQKKQQEALRKKREEAEEDRRSQPASKKSKPRGGKKPQWFGSPAVVVKKNIGQPLTMKKKETQIQRINERNVLTGGKNSKKQ